MSDLILYTTDDGKSQIQLRADLGTVWLTQRIVQEEQQGQHKAQYGTRLMEALSIALTADLGKGFSYANLYNFRQFYRVFPDQQILYTLCRELSWSHPPRHWPDGHVCAHVR